MTGEKKKKKRKKYKGGLKGKPGPNGRIIVDKRPKRIAPTKRTKASRVTDFNIHVRSTLPQEEESTNHCNAPTYKCLCKMPAGKGTDHYGYGRCKTHESRAAMSVRRGNLKEIRTRYGGGVPTNLKSRYEQLLEDPELLSVNDEVAASKAVLYKIIDSIGDIDADSEEGMDKSVKLLKALDTVTRTNIKLKDMEQKSEWSISLQQFVKIVKQIGAIVKEELDGVDPVTANRLMRRLGNELDITGKQAMSTAGSVDAQFDVEQ